MELLIEIEGYTRRSRKRKQEKQKQEQEPQLEKVRAYNQRLCTFFCFLGKFYREFINVFTKYRCNLHLFNQIIELLNNFVKSQAD